MIAIVKELFTVRKQLIKLSAPILYGAWFTVLTLILLWGIGIGGTLPGYSQSEQAVLEATNNFPNPIEYFLFYPYYLLVYLGRFIIDDGIFVTRLISVLATMGACGCLLFLIRHKFGILMSLIGVTIFALNSWILQLARSGTPEATTIFFGLALLAIIILIRKNIQNTSLKVLALIIASLNWFIPLIPWFLIGFSTYMLYNYTDFRRLFSLRFRISIFILLILFISCIILGFDANPDQILALWGIPESLPSITQIIDNIWITIQSIFWQAPDNPENWLANLPFLDIFTASFILFGLYASRHKISKDSLKIFIFFASVLLLIAGLNDNIATLGMELFLVLIILIVIAGLNEFLTYWKKVFPINPLAKFIGIIIIVGLLNLSVFYQLRRYFSAWANNPQTQQIYELKSED